MTQHTEKDRETARQVALDWHESDEARCSQCQSPFSHEGLYDRIATALADEHARGRNEAKAEVDAFLQRWALEIDTGCECKHLEDTCCAKVKEPCIKCEADAILTSASSGPSLELRLRAEIAEAVGSLPRYKLTFEDGIALMEQRPDGKSLRRDDVLAAITKE